jgi:fructose-specific phosphotransferase system component IIB
MANELPKYVFHEEFGEGETINGMQTIDESGDVTNTDVMFEHGIVRDVPVEELIVLEGRGRPKGSKNKPKGGETKPTMPATKTPSNSEDDDSDGPSGPGIHGELLRHQDLGDLKHHEIEFHDGKKVKVSPEHRNKALAHIKSLMGPGKNPDTRMAALRKLGSNHETFKKMIGEEVEHLREASPASLANSALSALDKAHQLRRTAGSSTTGADGAMNKLADKHIEKAKRHVTALGAAVGAPKTAAATIAHIDKFHAAMKQTQQARDNDDDDYDDDNDPAAHHHYNAGDNILKMAHKTHNEEVEQVDEISKTAKQRYLGTAVGDLTLRSQEHGFHTGANFYGKRTHPPHDYADAKRKIKNRQVGIHRATKEEVEHLSEASPASLANSAQSALDKAHQLRRSAGPSTTGFDGHMNDLSDKHIEKAKRHVVALGAAIGAPKTAAATVAHIDKMHAAMKQSQHDRHNDEDFDDDNDPADRHHYNAGDNILKMAHKTHNEEVEQVDEKLIGKQKKLDKNHNGKLDRQDFKMLRKESVEPKVSVYTEANRFRSVENAVKEIMQNNTNLRQLAKEEEFKRNNPGHFED